MEAEPTTAGTAERTRLVGALAEVGYGLVWAADVSEPLARALGAEPAAALPGAFVGRGATVERVHGRTFVTCREPADVARCLAFASATGARVRFSDERPGLADEAARGDPAQALAACGDARDGLRIGAADGGRFVQERLAAGEVAETLVVEPGRVLRVRPRGRGESARVARWMARGRLAFLDGLRLGAQADGAARAARTAGWTFWPALVDALAGLVALGEWGGVVNDRLGPAREPPGAQGLWQASARGPLLPLGVFPFRGGPLLADAAGVLVGPPWEDAPALVPMASSARALLEKVALEDELRGTPVGRAPWVRVQGTAGRDFWRRLRAARDEAASDATVEHWLGDGVWVVRGVDAGGPPFVRLSVVSDDALVVLARRLAKTAGGALLAVDCAGPEGWARLERLRGAGLRAAPAD